MKPNYKYLVMVFIIIFVSIIVIFLSNIFIKKDNDTSFKKEEGFSIYIDNRDIKKNGRATYTSPKVRERSLSEHHISLSKKNDYIKIYFDVINNGRVDAYLSSINRAMPICISLDNQDIADYVCNHLKYKVYYITGSEVKKNDKFLKNTKTRMYILYSLDKKYKDINSVVNIKNIDLNLDFEKESK